MDDADAELLRRTRTGDVHVGALQADPPGVHAVDAGEDLHERRLAGAVFPDERVENGAGKSTLMKIDRKSTRLNSSHVSISYAVFCLKKKKRRPYMLSRVRRDSS